MNALGYPKIGRILRNRISAGGEAYALWEHYCKGFSTPSRDLLPADVSTKNRAQVQHVMAKVTSRRKPRLLLKITGWPRLGFLSRIFEDARFIHVLRDGRAVANSLVQVGFWWGWRGPENWRWGSLSSAHKEEWNKYDQSFIVLAAIQWKILLEAAERAKEYISKSNLLEIKYERLCSDPIELFKEVAEFSELEWTDDFENELGKYDLRSTNDKWARELNATQRRDLNEVLKGYLRRYDYA